MGTLRGHLKQPQERLHLPLLLPFLSLPVLGEASLKSSLEHWTLDNDSSETVSQTERKISPSCSPLASLFPCPLPCPAVTSCRLSVFPAC